MDVVASLTVGADIEHLSETKLISFIHAEISTNEDNDAPCNWPILDIGSHIGVLDVLESE